VTATSTLTSTSSCAARAAASRCTRAATACRSCPSRTPCGCAGAWCAVAAAAWRGARWLRARGHAGACTQLRLAAPPWQACQDHGVRISGRRPASRHTDAAAHTLARPQVVRAQGAVGPRAAVLPVPAHGRRAQTHHAAGAVVPRVLHGLDARGVLRGAVEVRVRAMPGASAAPGSARARHWFAPVCCALHTAGALSTPRACAVLAQPHRMEPIDHIEHIQKERWELLCCLCKQRMGAKLQCKECYQVGGGGGGGGQGSSTACWVRRGTWWPLSLAPPIPGHPPVTCVVSSSALFFRAHAHTRMHTHTHTHTRTCTRTHAHTCARTTGLPPAVWPPGWADHGDEGPPRAQRAPAAGRVLPPPPQATPRQLRCVRGASLCDSGCM
jgi:hypothetical protein